MSNIFLSNEILVFIFLQLSLYILLFISFVISLTIIKNWDYTKSTAFQYGLEKRVYLVILIISFVLFSKIFIFFYFIYGIDRISFLLSGAMCAAGVFSSNSFGELVLGLKILNLFFIGLWLILNRVDLKQKDYKYTKLKFIFFAIFFIFFTFEVVLDFYFLYNIPIGKEVFCCSIIYGEITISTIIPFGLSINNLVLLFYLLSILLVILSLQKKAFLLFIFNLLFTFISYFSVTYFFSTYIYELPTHQCPFCMLQKEYHFIGYLIWCSLFLSLFFSICTNVFLRFGVDVNRFFKLSLIFNLLFVFIVSFYLLRYYILNGVLL